MIVTVFGYLILITDFYDLFLCFLLIVLVSIEIYQTLKQYLNTFSNTSKFVKNTSLDFAVSTLRSVFGNVVKHGFSCLTHYICHLLFPVRCSLMSSLFSFSSSSCWISSDNNLIWTFVSFVVIIEVVSKTNLKES